MLIPYRQRTTGGIWRAFRRGNAEMNNESGAVWDLLRDYGIEIRALKRRVEAVTAGDSVRADAITGVIPAANAPVYWWYNGNLLGAGTKVDLRQHSRVWISGSFIADRAYYDIGTYPDLPSISGVDWNANDSLVGWGRSVDFHAGTLMWISGAFVGGEAVITIGSYGGSGGGMSGVDFAANGDPLCFGGAIDLQEEWGIWVSGTCVAGEATFKIGAYYQGGGGGASGTVAFYENDGLFCECLELDMEEGYGVWISGTCEDGGAKARYKVGVYPSAGAGDDILALTYAVAF